MRKAFFVLVSAAVMSANACATLEAGAAATEVAQVADAKTAEAKEYGEKTYSHKKKEGGKHHRKASKGGGHSKADFFNAYDADDDGKVTNAEYVEVRDRGYDARDPNGDQKVLVDEYVAEYEARLAEDLAATRDRQLKQAYVRFGVLDKDKDGVLTREEFQASGQRMFKRLDNNEDGVVDASDSKDAY